MNREDEGAIATEPIDGTLPLPDPFKQMLKDGLVALSLANLFFARAWFAALYDGDFGYNNKLQVTTTTLLALATNLAWLTAVIWLVIRARRRWPNRWLHLAIDLLLFAAVLVPLDFCRDVLLDYRMGRLLLWLERPWVATPTALVLALVLWQHRRVARSLAVLVGVLSPLALYVLTRTALLLVGIEHIAQHSAEAPLPPPVAARPNQPRVVWMIFDETDQRLAFEQRPPDLQMPEFDRLRASCLAATNAYPPAERTMVSMPALITGQRLTTVQVHEASDLTLVLADSQIATNWSKLPSVFGSAREMGFNTALVGWLHPYSRVLHSQLNYCEWYPWEVLEPTRGPDFTTTFCRQIACVSGPVHIRHLYMNLCRAGLAASVSVVTNETYGLELLHLPPPHWPGIYNRKTGRFSLALHSDAEDYFNNLALADRFLGTLRQAMETSGAWDRTWVIMSADHSWRFVKGYDNHRDRRVPFLVKVPGHSSPLTYSPRMNTLLTHDLILAILRGELKTQADLVSWLDTHRSEVEPLSDMPNP